MEQDIETAETALDPENLHLSKSCTVKVVELNGFEAITADEMASKPSSSPYYRALASIRAIVKNGQTESFAMPVTTNDVKRVAGRLSASELDALLLKFSELFGSDEVKEAIKKGPNLQ